MRRVSPTTGRQSIAAAFWLAACLAGGPSVAHPLDPALLELWETAAGHVEVLWRIPASRPREAALKPVLPAHCRQLEAGTARRDSQRLSLRFEVACEDTAGYGLVGEMIGVEGLAARGTDVLLRVHLADGHLFQAVLRGDSPTATVTTSPGFGATLRSYLGLGFTHILGGFDHLLFVLGLLFLVDGRRRLVLTVTAFTVGHSLTLALASLGWLRISSATVELAIAASLWVLAVELTRRGPRETPRSPARLAAAFGLLHGLGFAGALAEAGLPEGDIPLALLAFNLGIELGQLAFIGAVWLAFAALRRLLPHWRATLEQSLAQPAAYLIGTLAGYWICQRGAGLLAGLG